MIQVNQVMRMYCRLSNIEQTLKSDCILYLYSKNTEGLLSQAVTLKKFCNSRLLKPNLIYEDSNKLNFLSNKENLMKLISENSNVDVLVTSIDRLSKNILELTDIQKLCKMKKIRFFDVSARQYVFDILDNIKNVKKDYEL